MKFQFDPEKAKSNLKKHMVSFADAEAVFYDPLAIHQEDHYSEGEEFRYDEIRVISVRHATRQEKIKYESGI